jgi:hypothetical protein
LASKILKTHPAFQSEARHQKIQEAAVTYEETAMNPIGIIERK